MEYYNDFTRFLDMFRTDDIMNMEEPYNIFQSTYLWLPDIENKCEHIAFRLPGATRGHIVVDENLIIRNIVFYDETCFSKKIHCYKKEVEAQACTEFIGTKLDVINGTKSLFSDESTIYVCKGGRSNGKTCGFKENLSGVTPEPNTNKECN